MAIQSNPLHERIYSVIRQVPPGKVATYGQIARIVGKCTPIMVGYALSAVTAAMEVPWHRVINSQGKISLQGAAGYCEQRQLLEAEGIEFDGKDKVNLKRCGWSGPDEAWLEAHGFDVLWFMRS